LLSPIAKAALAAGAVIALTAFQKANASGTLNFYPDSLRNIELDGITPVATFGLVIQNPSSQRFVVKSLAGNLTANGFRIGNVSSFTPIVINANSQVVYLLTVRLSLIGVVQDIINAFNGNGVQQTVRFNAWINVDNYSVPVDMSFKIP